MFAPSQLNKIDDGICVLSARRGRGGTSPLNRFRLLRNGPPCGLTLLTLRGWWGNPWGSRSSFGTIANLKGNLAWRQVPFFRKIGPWVPNGFHCAFSSTMWRRSSFCVHTYHVRGHPPEGRPELSAYLVGRVVLERKPIAQDVHLAVDDTRGRSCEDNGARRLHAPSIRARIVALESVE